MVVLIDGYNLLHAAGLAGPNRRAARRRLLGWLADSARAHPSSTIHVIFDAQDGPADTPETDHRGIRVRFAFRRTADDLIEELLTSVPPASVTVVSNDSRLHEAARRRGCPAWSCQQFMDWLIEADRPLLTPAMEAKPLPLSADETADLLRAFTSGR
jgi:predicted RNA-binding protein with PIN domain